MVNFWATWCAPAAREIPLLNKMRRAAQAQNAEIVGIAVDFSDDVLKFVQKAPLDYPLLIGEEDGLAAADAFGMGMAFPFSVFADSQNRILTIKVGELHEDEANFAFDRLARHRQWRADARGARRQRWPERAAFRRDGGRTATRADPTPIREIAPIRGRSAENCHVRRRLR